MKAHRKIPIVRKKLKGALGATDFVDNKPVRVAIDVTKHKTARELASTIKHELLHVKHPKMTEKQVYKRTGVTKIKDTEIPQLLSKVRMKALNYKGGAIKRKFKMGRGTTAPGDFISKMNESKSETIKKSNKPLSKEHVAIRGMV